jgi:hypothetical protein
LGLLTYVETPRDAAAFHLIWLRPEITVCFNIALMEEDRAEALRRRIALYRGYLREGVEGALALEYLRQIAEDEAELNRIEPGERR